jgi:hypothetical protein
MLRCGIVQHNVQCWYEPFVVVVVVDQDAWNLCTFKQINTDTQHCHCAACNHALLRDIPKTPMPTAHTTKALWECQSVPKH